MMDIARGWPAALALLFLATAEAGAQQQGLLGEYYNFGAGGSPQPPPRSPAGNSFTATPDHRRIDATVDFGFTMNPGPAPGVNADHFVVAWSGFVTPTESGNHTFGTISDDGVRLWVNDVLVRDDWVDQGPAGAAEMQTVPALNLTAGTPYKIRMEIYENQGGEAARLYWQPPSATSPAIIPSSALSPPPNPGTPTITAAQNGFDPQINVSWTAVSGQDIRYTLQRSENSGPFVDVPGMSSTTATTYTDTSITFTTGQSYCYQVRATDFDFLVGNYSTPACATIQLPPPRTNDHEEGLFEDKCACGSSIPASGGAALALAALMLASAAVLGRR